MSIFDKFRMKKKERKVEAPPAPSSAEPPVQAEVKIDTEIKRKELQIGDMLEGRYEIRAIKEGGMGSVYIAYDNEWHRMFAIKSFQEKFLWNKNITNRFIKEAETWVNQSMHNNIVWAEHVEKIHGKPYIFLEYIDGGDLTSWIGKIDIPQSLDFAIQVCNGMEYAYKEMGIVHRDIKPSNVMITKDGVAKVTDFGLVKVFEDAYSSETKDESFQEFSLIKTGSAIGTPSYMSPEQFKDTKNVETESDIYSFGVMLYEMLTGRLPFYADSMETYMRKHLTEEPRKPGEMNSEITAELGSIVMQCLQKNPKHRYHNFTELKEELMDIYENVTGEAYELSEIIDDDLSAAEAWNSKGFSLHNLGRYEEAISCYSKALEMNPEFAVAWNNKGTSLKNLGKVEEAISCYSKAIEINPQDAEAWTNKGGSLDRLGRFEEAITCLDKALGINPALSVAWTNKGISLKKLGRIEEDISCYSKALEINPQDAWAWTNKGISLDSLGRLEEAISCYSKALEINPQDEGAWYNKGISLAMSGRFEEAINCFDKTLEINLEDAEAWTNKGSALGKLGRLEDALQCYDKALEINPRLEMARKNKEISLRMMKSR